MATDDVWRALGHPDRRAIVDALRERPRLTGDLVALLTRPHEDPAARRFAVQRHLKTLRESGLVVVTPQGRGRANALNASALYQATIGWLDPTARRHAARLDALKHLAEDHASATEDPMDIRHIDVTLQIDISATPEEVWNTLTTDASAWWGAPYTLIDGAPEITMEAALGGLVRERLGTREALWGHISEIEPHRRLAWTGRMGMGDAATGTVTVSLAPSEDGTTVRLQHEAIGAVGEATQAAYDEGWDDLLHRLRAHVERGEAYGTSGRNAPMPAAERVGHR